MCNINELNIKINKNNKKIYKKILELMEEKNFSQKELAKILDVQPSTVCRTLKILSNGKSILTETLFKFADGLGVEVVELLR